MSTARVLSMLGAGTMQTISPRSVKRAATGCAAAELMQSCELHLVARDGWVSRPPAVLGEQAGQVLLLANAAAR